MAKTPFHLVEQIPFQTEDIKSQMKPNEKLALVLPGGGSFGRKQFAVIYWLYQIGILERVDLICGTSVGGLNTVLTAKYKDQMEKALDVWNNITQNKDVYDGMMKFNNFFDWIGMASQIFKDNKGKSILNPKGLYSMLDREFGNIALKDLKCNICITATDISEAKMVEFNTMENPDFSASLLTKMTSAIPIIFPPVKFNNKLYSNLAVDGGVGRNNPIELAIKHGATKIILIGTSPNTLPRKELQENLADCGGRLETAIMHIFEENAWEEVDDHRELSKYDPIKYPVIEVLDWYPPESDMVIENEVDALNFTGVQTMQKGYDSAVARFTKKVLQQFLLS